MEPWRLVAFFAYAIVAALFVRWLAGAIAVKLGHPREAGYEAAASGGMSLLFRPLSEQELAAKRVQSARRLAKQDQRAQR